MLTQTDGQEIVFDLGRCTQCGTCLAACPTDALSDAPSPCGMFSIDVDPARCVRCGVCVRACPAGDLPAAPMQEADLRSAKRAFLAHAAEASVRREGSSGGVARALAKAALESGFVDAVYCLTRSSVPPHAQGELLRRAEETDRIANSVYEALPVNRALPRPGDRNLPRRLLLIGTHCQLEGAERLYAGADIALYRVAILCKQQKTSRYAAFCRRVMRQTAAGEHPIRFRGGGDWPGSATCGQAQYTTWYRPFSMELWRVAGCRYCPNAIGRRADITLADPWGLVPTQPPSEGLTLTVLRTNEGADLWKACEPHLREAGSVTPDDVLRSIEWPLYQRKMARIAYHLGEDPSRRTRLRIRLGDLQRRLYERILERLVPPELCQRIMNRLLIR